MATNRFSDSEQSDNGEYVTDIDSSDFSDFDISLLEDAEKIMKTISPVKEKIPSKVKKLGGKKNVKREKSSDKKETKVKK